MNFASPSGTRPIALITGATGRIGRSLVEVFAIDHDVIAVGRDPERLADMADHNRVFPRPIDLLDFDSYAALIEALPRLDVLVHSAAIFRQARLDQSTPEFWNEHLAINVVAPAELTRRSLPLLRASAGTVVFLNSGSGTRAVAGLGVYSATKHALRAVADTFRAEETGGVRVATVSPGPTDDEEARQRQRDRGIDPSPRYVSAPHSIAQAVRAVTLIPADSQVTDLVIRPRDE